MFLDRAGPEHGGGGLLTHQELDLLKPKNNTQLPGASPRPPVFLCFVLGAGTLRDFALDSENLFS